MTMGDDTEDFVVETKFQLAQLFKEEALSSRHLQGFAAPQAELTAADLDSVRIEQVDLQRAIAADCRLENAILRGVDLRDSVWTGSLLSRTTWQDCDATKANFTNASVMDSQWTRVRLGGSVWHEAKLQRMQFSDVEWYSADLSRSVITKCQFSSTGSSSLSRAVLQGAAFIDVNLRNMNLYGADAQGALFVRCDLRGANVCEVNFTGAHFVGCRLEGAEYDGAKGLL